MTANGACCDRSFPGEFKLAGEQVLETLIVHDQHDEVYAFEADLQSGATAANRDKRGGAPTFSGTARRHTPSVFATKDKATFDQVRHHQDALRLAQNLFGDPLVWSRHNRVQNFDG
jgi:hypothetical protein